MKELSRPWGEAGDAPAVMVCIEVARRDDWQGDSGRTDQLMNSESRFIPDARVFHWQRMMIQSTIKMK